MSLNSAALWPHGQPGYNSRHVGTARGKIGLGAGLLSNLNRLFAFSMMASLDEPASTRFGRKGELQSPMCKPDANYNVSENPNLSNISKRKTNGGNGIRQIYTIRIYGHEGGPQRRELGTTEGTIYTIRIYGNQGGPQREARDYRGMEIYTTRIYGD